MRKNLTFLVLFIISAKLFAIGTGFSLNYKTGTDFSDSYNVPGLAFTVELERIPVQIDIKNQYDFSKNDLNFSVNSDFFFFKKTLSDFSTLFCGPGLMTGISFNEKSLSLNEGFRTSFGFNVTKFDGFFEFFTKAAFQLSYKKGIERKDSLEMEFPVDIGFLFWY